MSKLIASVYAVTFTWTSLSLLGLIYGKVYMVGDEAGWAPGNDYSLWVHGKTFFKGDVLVFRYAEGYSVEEVTEEKYKRCDKRKAIFSGTNGNTSIPLIKLGLHYFIGAAFDECRQGMNFTLTLH